MKKKAVIEKTPKEIPFYLKGNWPVIIITVLCFALYLPTLWYGFSPMDEQWVILKNKEALSQFQHLPSLFLEPTLGMYYRPVWTSSFLIDMVIGGGSPGFFHFTNILLHICCSLLLFRFLKELQLSKPIAFIAALFFAVHPINVHTVAWIPGRNDSLLCLFTLLSSIFLLQYLKKGKIQFLLFHFLGFAMALFTKENAIVLPFIYFLLGYNFRETKNRNQVIGMISSWLVLGIGWFFLRKHFIDYFPLPNSSSLGNNLIHFAAGLTLYIGKTILPIEQSVMPVLHDTSLLPFLFITLILVFITLKFGVKDRKIAILGICWFFIFILIPTWVGATNSNGEHYEHRIYTSLIGAFLFLSQLKINITPSLKPKLVVLALLTFSVKTVVRCDVYKDEFTFAKTATIESPSIYFFHDMLGNLYVQKNNYYKAIESYTDAIELNPHKIEFYNHRGNAYFEIKDYQHAKEDDDKALELKNDQPQTMINRSMANYYLGNHSAALEDLQDGEHAGATNVSQKFINDLYNAFQQDTILICSRQLEQDSLNDATYNQRGICLLRMNKVQEAVSDFNKALYLKPNSAAYRHNRDFAVQQWRNSGK